MKNSNALTIFLIGLFLGVTAWLGWRTWQIQQAGMQGLPMSGMADYQMESAVQQLVEQPDQAMAQRLLPQLRELHAENPGPRERTLLAIVLYYSANMDPDYYHDYLREALPLMMENYSASRTDQGGSGELLLNFLAMAQQEDAFERWKRDLLSREPYMQEELDLLALELWLETDQRESAKALIDRYIKPNLQSRSATTMAFKIHCMLNQYDQASQFESEAIDIPQEDNSTGKSDNSENNKPVVDRYTYITTLDYLLKNARFQEARAYLDRTSNELLDPAYIALHQAIILASEGRSNSPEFAGFLGQISQSPFMRMSRDGAEASVYAALAEIGGGTDCLSEAAALYAGNEMDTQVLQNLSLVCLYTNQGTIELLDSNGVSHELNALQLAVQALESARNFEDRQQSLMLLAAVYAAQPRSAEDIQLQQKSLEYLHKALLTDVEDPEEGFPASLRTNLSVITSDEFIRKLRRSSPQYDVQVHELIRAHVDRTREYYGSDPLSVSEP
ncbi:hypothetical protein KDL44_08890 [bacterium]|nr:hypothetical protein [bacterium]